MLGLFRKKQKKVIEPDLYRSLSDLPFIIFERCFIHQDYRGLLKNTPSLEEDKLNKVLTDAWFDLYSQYCDVVDDRTAIKVAKLNYQILSLAAKIEKCTLMISVLKSSRSEAMEKILSSELMGIQFADFNKALSQAESRIKSHVIKLNELVAERDSIVPKSHKELTEQYFTDILIECSKLEGYKISKKDISALEFCSYFKRLKEQIERNSTLQRHK